MSRPPGQRRTATGTYADEIGIEFGVYGDWRLKAVYTPVFTASGPQLRAVAAAGDVSPFVYGRAVDERMFRRAVPPRDRPAVAVLGAALCLRNLRHTFVDGLKLILTPGAGSAASPARIEAAARALAREIDRNGLRRGDVFVDLSPLAGDVLKPAAGALRARGVGVAVREKGDGVAFAEGAPFPDLVVIDGGWFGAVARQASTARLFGALARGYRAQGALAHVEGIAMATELGVALDAGADWLSGPLLAPAAPAGAIFPEKTLPVAALLDERRVVPLVR